MDVDQEILEAFLEESADNLDQLDRDLLALESGVEDPELIARVFRAVHTVKGTCGFLGLARLERVAHAGESLLDAVRSGAVPVGGAVCDALLRLVDRLRLIVGHVASDGSDGEGDEGDDELIALLEAMITGQASGPAPSAEGAVDVLADQALRVDVTVLDDLMNLVGELVLVRNQLNDLVRDDSGRLGRVGAELDRLTGTIQGAVMRTRLQQVGVVLTRLPRLARDLCAMLGKQVELRIDGERTTLDKAVLDAVRDPLVHLVRNAVDHGIETPDERVAAGKPATGIVRVSARTEGASVVIDVQDDGAGIDVDRLRERAVRAGVIGSDEAQQLTDAAAADLVFLPGVTTAAAVTSVSGRGVGMDAVRAGIEGIGGSVEVTTTRGVGTSFRLRVPLTVAITAALVVESAGRAFAVPQSAVVELVGIDDAGTATVGGAPVLRRHDRLIPLVPLSELLGLAPSGGRQAVVVEVGDLLFGVVVDAVLDTADVVVKALGHDLSGLDLYSGATVLGDGSIAMVLDAPGLAARAGLNASATERPLPAAEPDELLPTVPHVLVLDQGRRRAVPLAAVERLAEVEDHEIEHLSSGAVAHLESGIVPIGRQDGGHVAGPVTVVVCRSGVAGPFALAVDTVLDVVELAAPPPGQPSTTALHDDRLVELVDVAAVARRLTAVPA